LDEQNLLAKEDSIASLELPVLASQGKEKAMILKKLLQHERVRTIQGSFAFIEHRFVRDGFWVNLNHHELLLYFLLILVADRQGLSYYSYDKLCSLLRLSVEEYVAARNSLIEQDLIAFDGTLFQVLALPNLSESPEKSTRSYGGEHDRTANHL
jgi:hypothetical protein